MLSDLGGSYQRAMFGLQEKYSSGNSKVESQWRGPVVIGWFVFMIFYGLVAVVLNLLFIRFLLPAKFKTAEFLEKRTCIVLASTVITFAIVVMVLGLFVLRHNFFVMACKLLMQYMWLLAVILLSMLVRLNGKQVNIPSYQVKAGDVIEIKEKFKSAQRYKDILEVTAGRMVPAWLESDQENLRGTVKELPTRDEIDVPVNEMLIVELYSK